jgi:hypothetical protein
MKKKLTFHINNMAYSINIDDSLEYEIINFLPKDKNITTQELLLAYIKKSQEIMNLKKDLEKLSNKFIV